MKHHEYVTVQLSRNGAELIGYSSKSVDQHTFIVLQQESMMSPTRSEEPVLVNGNGTPSFVLTPESASQHSEQNKSQCSSLSDAENFEWTSAGGGNAEEALEVDSEVANGGVNGNSLITSDARQSSGINRNTWLRTSLRRSSPNHQENLPNRRWGSFRHNGRRQQQLGSNALASQLYRSSSFNSSGRSSTCDTTDDTSMYSDASLEEDVHDLHHKVSTYQPYDDGYLKFV
ncbi:hypothetical protein JTB14_029992 [Gonioctena quinquepunctata]|nr:hypothetical protein JTB14_029992 [Gonioctena quinquepunctata]